MLGVVQKIPCVNSPDSNTYGEGSLGVLIDQYAENKIAQTLHGEEYIKEALITTEVRAEWTTFCNYIAKQPKQDVASHLNNLLTTDMVKTRFPHLFALVCGAVCANSIPCFRTF